MGFKNNLKEKTFLKKGQLYWLQTSQNWFSCSVVSDSLCPTHWLQHASLPCPSPAPRAYSNSCPVSQWCHPTISSSVLSFSSCLQKSTQTHVHWVSDAIQPSHHLSSPSAPAFNLSSIRIFSNESALHIRWPKYWSFSFNISPSNEHFRLISFRMDWLDLLAVQGTLKSLQHHSSKASILWH